MSEKYDYLIVDCYNLMHISTWNKQERTVEGNDGVHHSEGIIDFLSRMETIVKQHLTEDGKIYWLMDNAKTSIQRYRKSLSEDYKKTRVEQPAWFYRSLNDLELILKSYREDSFLFRLKFLEADDYVPSIISNVVRKDQKALLVSTDMDWCRSLADNVDVYKNHGVYRKEDFFREFGFEATYSNICFFKTFYGDDTDNILPALEEFPKLFFLETIKEFSMANSFINHALDGKILYLDSGWMARIERDRDALLLNWNLVTAPEINLQELEQYQVICHFEEKKLRISYDTLNILGIVDKRVKTPKKSNGDIMNDLLGGETINRKR